MRRLSILVLASVLGFSSLGFAFEYKPIYEGFTPIRESKAYEKFAVRPLTDFSKLLYLIDRFGDANIEISYDNQTYSAKFATTVARWFLARNYKKQTPEQWINQWCTRSLGNQLIYVKLPDGKFRASREILMDELAALDEVVRENNRKPKEEVVVPVKVPEVKTIAETRPILESVAIAAETDDDK